MTALVVFVVAGAGTYLARSSFVLLVGDRVLPPLGAKIIRNVGPPVLAALTTSLLVTPDARQFLTSPPEVVAVLVAVGLAWRTKGFLWSFMGGMITLWVLEAIL